MIADKWRTYQKRLEMRRARAGITDNSTIYIDGTKVIKTPEAETLAELGLRRDCCRKHFLTHVELIEKI